MMHLKIEKDDLWVALLSTLTILITWLALGWRPELLAMGGDATNINAAHVHELLKNGGDWTRTIYTLAVQGGARIHDVIGTVPVYQISGWLGLSTLTTLNLSLFLSQFFYAFLGLRIAEDSAEKRFTTLLRITAVLLLAFAPFLGWKYAHGHLIMIWGGLALLVALTWIFAIQNRRVSMTLAVISCLALVHCFSSVGFQVLLYSVVFGAPILVGALLIFEKKAWFARKTELGILLCLLFGAVGLSLLKLAGMLHYATSDDAARAIGGAPVVYSTTFGRMTDWLTSLPWNWGILDTGREAWTYHEINYPLGPFFFLPFLLPWKKFKWLQLGLGVSLFLAVSFSMDLILTRWLLAVIPPLGSFRVPLRAIIPFALLAVPLGIGAIAGRVDKNTPTHWSLGLLFVAVAVVAFFAPAELREALAWLIVAYVAIAIWKWQRVPQFGVVMILLVFAGISLAAFQQRTAKFFPLERAIQEATALSDRIKAGFPAVNAPLARTVISVPSAPEFDNNATWLSGIPGLDAYWFPSRRFIELVTSLNKVPYNATLVNFKFLPDLPTFLPIQQLYNVTGQVFPEGAVAKYRPERPTPGAAWFSGKISRLENSQIIASAMRSEVELLGAQLRKTVWISDQDPAVKKVVLPATVSARCAEGKIREIKQESGKVLLRLVAENPTETPCPLTLSMNYAEILRIRKVGTSGQAEELVKFPANISLTGVLVPPGVSELSVEAGPYRPWWAWLGFVLGCALTLLALVGLLREGARKS